MELSIDDSKVVTSLVCVIILVLYILHDHLIGDGSTGSSEESSTPEVFAPEALLELWELLEYLPGRLAFEVLRHLGDRDLRGHRDKEVDMIFRDMTTDNLYVMCIADLSDEVSYPGSQTARQDRLVVFSGPYQMIFTVKDRV